jgi:hypothetical protein
LAPQQLAPVEFSMIAIQIFGSDFQALDFFAL